MTKDTIRRAPRDREHPYMNLIRKIPQDPDLDLEELGLLVYILSLPNNWELQLDHIRRTKKLGINKLPKMMKKFVELGYCKIFKIRDELGRFSHNEYAFYEEKIDPQVIDNKPSDPHHENQEAAHNESEPVNGNRGTVPIQRNPLDGPRENSDDIHIIQKEDNRENIIPPIPPKGEDAAKAAEKNNKPSSSSDFSQEVQHLYAKMLRAMQSIKPDYKSNPRIMVQILTFIDYMLRLDGRQPQKVLDVFRWAIADEFWAAHMFKPNPAKYLREKFDQLEMKMRANDKQNYPKSAFESGVGEPTQSRFRAQRVLEG